MEAYCTIESAMTRQKLVLPFRIEDRIIKYAITLLRGREESPPGAGFIGAQFLH